MIISAVTVPEVTFADRTEDNAPAHKARENVQKLSDFIDPTLWLPANSPDLYPVDYWNRIWRKLQECVYRSLIHDVAQRKSRLIEEWEQFSQLI